MKLISIITINYNNADGLTKTIKSVREQNFTNFELIVIDGDSTDKSVEIIKQSKEITTWISEKDKGIYDAQNKGIAMAKGTYLLFLNSGDCLANSNILQTISEKLNGKKSFYYGNLLLEKNGTTEQHLAPEQVDVDFMLNSTFWHPCVFIRADLFSKYGLYNATFKIAGDYEFFVRCWLKPDVSSEYLNEFICLFDGNGISNNLSHSSLQTQEREEAWKMNLALPFYHMLKSQNAFSRSKYAPMINFVQGIRGKQKF